MLLTGIKLLSARTYEYSESILEAYADIYSVRRLKLDHTKPGAKSDFSMVMFKLNINELK